MGCEASVKCYYPVSPKKRAYSHRRAFCNVWSVYSWINNLVKGILLNVRGFAVSLLPVLGLLATLLIASPIWYWPRYGAAAQFLIPFYVFLLAAACGAFRKDDAKARDPLPQAGTETGEAKNRHASL